MFGKSLYPLIQLILTIGYRHIWEGLRTIWPDAQWPGQHHMNLLESRL
jgi:succinate dehydrogenase hydrophobic anchor subunit